MSRLSTFLSIFLLITTTSVVLTYAQKVEPTIDPEPINLQYKAMLYRLDFKTIPSISPAMRSVLLLTTLYYIIVFAKAMVEIQIYRSEGKKTKSINNDEEDGLLADGNDMGSKLEGYERNLRGVMEGIPMLAILITFALHYSADPVRQNCTPLQPATGLGVVLVALGSIASLLAQRT